MMEGSLLGKGLYEARDIVEYRKLMQLKRNELDVIKKKEKELLENRIEKLLQVYVVLRYRNKK